MKLTIFIIFKYKNQWYSVHSYCDSTITTIHLHNSFHHLDLLRLCMY